MRRRRLATRPAAAAALCLATLLAGCAPDDPPQPTVPRWLVIGVDGADWRVIEQLWQEGRLPHLRALAERGVAGRLATDYGASPVIWTTIATGVTPSVHGITGFAVPTPDGDVPVSSSLRNVPALWNMLSAAGRRTAVVSWWASWPAEAIDGVIVSDRYELGVEGAVQPPALRDQVAAWAAAAASEPNDFDSRLQSAERDHLTQYLTRQLLDVDFDLVLTYFRSVDIASHHYWKYLEPEKFPDVDPTSDEATLVPSAYEAVDRVVGRLVAAAGPSTHVMVLSDHGFHALPREKTRLFVDLDRILERVGLLARDGSVIDWQQTRLYTYATPSFRLQKRVKFAPSVTAVERSAVRRQLSEELGRITWGTGEAMFTIRDPRPREARDGADLMVEISTRGATRDLRYGDELWPEMLPPITKLSGSHSNHTKGVFFAAGPEVDRSATTDAIDIHDIAPTLLYALGLPVAEDFAGDPFRRLFAPDTRRPVRTIASWGTRTAEAARRSSADDAILDDLRALGYID